MHAKALYVLQVGGQLWWVGMYHHIDEHWQEIISTCRTSEVFQDHYQLHLRDSNPSTTKEVCLILRVISSLHQQQ